MRILIPWDELSGEQQEAISGDIWANVFYENVMKHCTTPLRTPEELGKEETRDVYHTWVNGGTTIGLERYVEIAARPPKPSAVEEMDGYLHQIYECRFEPDKLYILAERAEKMRQAVKAELKHG